MRYYIIGSNNDKFKVTSKDYLINTANLDDAVSKFDQIYLDSFKNMYLIADFGLKKNIFNDTHKIDLKNKLFPFIILAEYHFDNCDKNYFRHDDLAIMSNNITQEFKCDNIKVIENLNYYIDNKIPARLFIKYEYEGNTVRQCIMDTAVSLYSDKHYLPKIKIANNG